MKNTSKSNGMCYIYCYVFASNVWLNWLIWLDFGLDGSIRIYIYIHMENCASMKEKVARNLFIYFFLRKLGKKKRNGRVFVLSLEERRMFVVSIEKVK